MSKRTKVEKSGEVAKTEIDFANVVADRTRCSRCSKGKERVSCIVLDGGVHRKLTESELSLWGLMIKVRYTEVVCCDLNLIILC